MNLIRGKFTRAQAEFVWMILLATLTMAVPGMANKTKPTELPAKVIAHLPLQEASGSEMLLQTKSEKHYLYVQKASKLGFMVIDVTKPESPTLVNRAAPASDATAGKLEMVGPDVALAEVPDKTAKGIIKSTENPTETVKILDLRDPTHPKVLQTFTDVTSMLPDGPRGLIYLTNNEGLWILVHKKEALAPVKKKRPCSSEDALSAAPPDCE